MAGRLTHPTQADFDRLLQAVQTSGEVIFTTDCEGVFTFVNSQFERLYGHTAVDVVGRATPRLLKSGLLPPEPYAELWQRLSHGETVEGEFVNRTRNGDLLHVAATISPIRDGEHAIVGFLAIQRDVTERKKAEDALRSSQARLQLISDNVLDLVCQLRPDGTFVYASPSYRTVLGYSPQELIGRSAFSFMHREDVERTQGIFSATVARGTSGRAELRYRHADGHYLWLEAIGTVLTDEAGTTSGGVVCSRDITERKLNEEALRRRDGILSAVGLAAERFLHAHDWRQAIGSVLARLGEATAVSRVVIFENQPGTGDEILISRRHEWRAAGIEARPDATLTDLPFRAMGFSRWAQVLGGGQGIFQHVRDLPAAERAGLDVQGILSVAVVPISVEGRWWGFIGLDACTTERDWVTLESDALFTAARILGEAIAREQAETMRARLEDQLRQAQKMESVGRLASGVAHDFNNLLTVINGMSELVLAHVRPDDPVHDDVQEILRAGKLGATLTQQLLAFGRQQFMEPRVLSLDSVVARIEGLLRRLVGEGIDMAIVRTPGLGHVKVDPGQLEQVLTNLALNARDAMPEGGRLTIDLRNVTLDEAFVHDDLEAVPPGSYVRLTVSDSGVGMDEATRTRIFEPFFTTKDQGKGTGLGLSTVFGIVRQSRGFIRVYSEVGHGSSFTIYLPQVPEAAGPQRPESVVTSGFGTETILVVEDNAGLRKLATRFLEGAGYTVLAAATGDAALRLLEGQTVHLLLSDVVMPGMSGRLLAEQVTRARPEMKVLYMSGYTSDTVVRHSVLEATTAFLGKPFSGTALLRKVREVLDS